MKIYHHKTIIQGGKELWNIQSNQGVLGFDIKSTIHNIMGMLSKSDSVKGPIKGITRQTTD